MSVPVPAPIQAEIDAYARAMEAIHRRNIHTMPLTMAQYLQWTESRIAKCALLVDQFKRLHAEATRRAMKSDMRPKL